MNYNHPLFRFRSIVFYSFTLIRILFQAFRVIIPGNIIREIDWKYLKLRKLLYREDLYK